jgi:carboxyl-terminal processing protease
MTYNPTKSLIIKILILFFLINNLVFSQKKTLLLSSAEKTNLLVDVLKRNHCEPRNIDNKLSIQLYDAFLKNLDTEKNILTTNDLVEISIYKTLLDDQIKAKDLVFLKKISQIYFRRLQKLDSLIAKTTELPINFYSKKNYESNKNNFASSETEWIENWQNELNYQIISIVFNSLNLEKHLNSKVNFNDKAILIKKEIAARKRVRDNNLRQTKSLLGQSKEDFDNEIANIFLQSLANLYDQHTEYFGTEDAEDYLNATNPEKEIFGFRFGENKNGEIEISNLVPGSPAWKSGLLNNSDVLVAVQWEGDELIDVIGADETEINELLTEHANKALSLTVRKPSQEIVKVTLNRAMVLQEEESVTSYILEDKTKFGYINLPSFYSNFEYSDGLGCANDVAKELVKLNKEGIQGLVLDLRFNGGGSLKEAIDLAGIFIDQGVFGAYKDNSPKSIIVKDPNRGSIYDGPMIVLVNQMSASASEILAGILQDYKRAIIVGSKTFGKGVAQTIIPLDSTANDPKDFAKTTIFRIFRPTGKPLQSRGVVPDIVLPFILDSVKIGEIHEGIALSADTLNRSLMYFPLPDLPISKLIAFSQKRLTNDSSMLAIKKIAGKLKEMETNANHKISLDWNVFQKEYKKNRIYIDDLMKETNMTTPSFSVNLTELEKQRSEIDVYKKEHNKQIFSTLKKDVYISEALKILLDLNSF